MTKEVRRGANPLPSCELVTVGGATAGRMDLRLAEREDNCSSRRYVSEAGVFASDVIGLQFCKLQKSNLL